MKAFWGGVVTIGALALLGAATTALPAEAGGRRAMRGAHGAGGGERMATFLGLTDEQKATWEQMHKEFRESTRATFEQQRPNMEKLRAALDAEQPDAAAVGRLVIGMHQQRKQTEQQHETFQQRLRATLMPEQQVKFDAAQALRPRHRGLGRGFGPGVFGPHGPGAPDAPEGEGPDDDAPFAPRGPRAERF
jgi:Spy/CpxP family protein refolding chaperone